MEMAVRNETLINSHYLSIESNLERYFRYLARNLYTVFRIQRTRVLQWEKLTRTQKDTYKLSRSSGVNKSFKVIFWCHGNKLETGKKRANKAYSKIKRAKDVFD